MRVETLAFKYRY